MEREEYPAGANQKIVVFVSDDGGYALDAGQLFRAVAVDAEEEEQHGWRIVSTSLMPMRQMGTAGNIFFQSGGQFATKAAVAVVYARA